MAYNPNTRLLLKFNEASGSPTVNDTSNAHNTATFSSGGVSSAYGVFGTNSAPVGNPGGAFAVSSVTVDNPGDVFSPGVTPRQFDIWYRRYGYPIVGDPQSLIHIAFANGDTITLETGTTLSTTCYGSVPATASLSYSPGVNTWRHYRLLIDGHTMRVGADGVEVCSTTIGSDIWTGTEDNPVVEIRFGAGQYPWQVSQGYLDAIEFTEGTVSWAGGAYSIPTSEPDDGGAVLELYGIGANTLDDVATSYQVVAPISASGATTLAAITGSGIATQGLVSFADSTTTLGNVTSSGSGSVANPPPETYRTNTRLLLKFAENQGANLTHDTSVWARTAPFSFGSVSTAQGVFGPGSGMVGNPGGGAVSDSLQVNPPAALMRDEWFDDKQFDIWFRPYAIGNHPLIAFQFANGDYFYLEVGPSTLTAIYNGTNYSPEISVTKSVAYTAPLNEWRHYRVVINSTTLRLGANGVDYGTAETNPSGACIWSGRSTNAIIDVRFGQAPPILGLDATHQAIGYIDAIEFTEGAVRWADGGNYAIPSAEPLDVPVYAPIYGSGANTLDPIGSIGDGVLLSPALCIGANTLDAVTSVGDAQHDHWLDGANTLDDITTEGTAAHGILIHALGDCVLDVVVSFCSGVAVPISRGGSSTVLEAIASAGAGGIGWGIATGENTVADVVQSSTGQVANYLGPTGIGSNSVEIASVGDGGVTVLVIGNNTTAAITSVGAATDEKYATGSSLITLVSSGAAYCETRGQGTNQVGEISGAGTSVVTTFGSGESSVSLSSFGTGILPIVASGSNTVEVTALEDDLWLWLPGVVCQSRINSLVVTSQRNHWSVRA